MIRTQIYIEESTSEIIRSIALKTGRKQSEIIRDAIAKYIVKYQPHDSASRLRRARGIWKDREDLPSIKNLRNEWDRNWD